jgi:hypothetical protein
MDIISKWYTVHKPYLLTRARISTTYLAQILEFRNPERVRERIRCGAYKDFADCIDKGKGRQTFDIYTARLIIWYENLYLKPSERGQDKP